MTIKQAGNLWLDALQANYLAESTLRKYRRVMRFFSDYYKLCDISKITLADLQRFRATRAHIKASTAVNEMQIYKGFFSFCEERGFVPASPARKLKPPRVPPNEKVPYTQDDVIRIFRACDRVGQHDYERLRCKAAILVMRYTGLRISDVILLRKDSISNGVLSLKAKKNGVAIGPLPLSPTVLNALAMLPVPLGSNGKREYFFWNQVGSRATVIADMQRVLRQVYKLSGVTQAHNHRWRHTLASDLLAKGATLPMVAHVLGISMLVCQKHYTKLTPEFQNSVNAILGRIGQAGSGLVDTIAGRSGNFLAPVVSKVEDGKCNEACLAYNALPAMIKAHAEQCPDCP